MKPELDQAQLHALFVEAVGPEWAELVPDLAERIAEPTVEAVQEAYLTSPEVWPTLGFVVTA